MTLEEAIWKEEALAYSFGERWKRLGESNLADLQKLEAEHKQYAEWLRELKTYREILVNAEKIIASTYGCVIIEGYKDVIDQMNEVFKEVNTDESNM